MRIPAKLQLTALAVVLACPAVAAAQSTYLALPIDSVEHLLAYAPFDLPTQLQGTRGAGDRTQRVDLTFADGTTIFTKWAHAPRGGEDFNNVPRYEVAAYRLQKLFLGDTNYVVPPTVVRAVPLDWYRTLDDRVDATFGGTRSVLVVLQAFLSFVTDENVFDESRLAADEAYARAWANANLLTYLIKHSDSNTGNLLISTSSRNPRVFSVDNGVAFGSEDSARGTRWRTLHTTRFPAETVARLRGITEDQLQRVLGVLAQWEVRDGELVRVPPTENSWRERGVREKDGVYQVGLTRDEIDDVWDRLESFLGRVDRGTYTTF